jgi:hypothetical protein
MYPSEWRTDDEGTRCTAFVELDAVIPAARCDKTADMFQEGGVA